MFYIDCIYDNIYTFIIENEVFAFVETAITDLKKETGNCTSTVLD